MNTDFEIQFDANVYSVQGNLTFQTVNDVSQTTQALFDGHKEYKIDLAGVTGFDSAGLALLMTWLRQAKQQGVTVSYTHISVQIMAVIKAAGLESILPIE